MNDLSRPWLGTPDRMIQYCPIECESELSQKLIYLIDTYGLAFDDDWWYWRAKKTKKNKGLIRPIKRTAVWFSQKQCPAEKHKQCPAEKHKQGPAEKHKQGPAEKHKTNDPRQKKLG